MDERVMAMKLSARRAARQAGCVSAVACGSPHGRTRNRLAITIIALIGAMGSASAEPGFSAWSRNPHSAARLIAAGRPATGAAAEREAAIEISLDPGYLTYWRQPGDAGLPPTIDTSQSTNVASVSVDFPAPRVFDEGGAQLFGYQGSVVLPLHVTLADPHRPATLTVALDYAVCAAICLPGKAALRLDLPDATAPEAARLIAAARAAVPRPTALGAPGPEGIAAVLPDKASAKPALQVTARGKAPATLFVEGPEGWFFVAGAPVEGTAGTLVFPVTVTDRPTGGTGLLDLRLTLVDETGAIEVPVHMDAGALTP